MSHQIRSNLRLLWVVAVAGVLAPCASPANAQERPTDGHGSPAAFTVDGRVALRSLTSLSDGHLQKMADVLTILATTDAARSAEWERIRNPLAEVARMNLRDRVSKAASHSTWGLVACTSFGLASGALPLEDGTRLFLAQIANHDDEEDDHQYADHRPNPHPSDHQSACLVHQKALSLRRDRPTTWHSKP